MALDDTRFSHITVTADDEDDVVIHAGARPEPAARPAAGPAGSQDEERPRPVEAPEGERRPAQPSVPASSADKGYRETTAEDLEGSPMSLMQKAIIVIAALFVVGFVAYYLFLR